MLEHSHHYFHQAADILALEGKIREILLRPNRAVKVAIVEERVGKRGRKPRNAQLARKD